MRLYLIGLPGSGKQELVKTIKSSKFRIFRLRSRVSKSL